MGRLTCLRPRIATLDTRSAKPPAKTVDPHYLTPEHQAWREEVIRRASGQCEHRSENGTRCFKKVPHVRLFADHRIEIEDMTPQQLAAGFQFNPDNGQALCGSHHTAKTAEARARRMAARSPAF